MKLGLLTLDSTSQKNKNPSYPTYRDYRRESDIATLNTFKNGTHVHGGFRFPPNVRHFLSHESPPHLHIADLSSVLIVLTAFSFLPQLYNLWSKKDGTGISIAYVLINLLVATEQLTLETYVTVNVPESAKGIFTHDPLSTGDWLNLVQTLVNLVMFTVL